MKLTKFEQSGFILETNSGFRLGIDMGSLIPLEKLEGITADATIASHIHGDHFSIEHIKKLLPKKVYLNRECIDTLLEETFPFEILETKTGTTFMIGDITVEIFSVDHGPNTSSPLKNNFGFLFIADNQKIYFGGDIFYPSGIDVSNVEVDYALLPVGTYYTFGPVEAYAFVQQFKKIGKIISMHYEKDPTTKDQFIKLAKDNFSVE